MKQQAKSGWQRVLVGLAPSIILGLILLVSGSGKVPGQTEFIDVLLKSFWTPPLAYLIGYCLPWGEVVLGVLLFIGVLPRIAAGLCLPLIAGFIANNSWALSQGMERFPQCGHCFGIWEEFLGAISPLQALCLDIVLFCLAIIIILFHPARFLSFRPWFAKQKGDHGMNLVSSQPKWLAGLIILVVGSFLFGGCAPPNEPPAISILTANEEWIVPSGNCQVECIASDPDGDTLSYVWSASGGSISGEGSVVTWIAPDALGAYTITVEVTDGRGGEATTQLTLDVRVNHPPVIKSLTAESQVVEQARSTNIKCVASDPDGDELNYLWTPTGGNISGQGATVTWTAPNVCGDYVVTVTVADSRGGQVSKGLKFKVIKPG